MAELIEFDTRAGAPAVTRDQRRPGRLDVVDPALLPLLRQTRPPGQEQVAETVDPGEIFVDPGETCVEPGRGATLSAARGILLGVALGTLTWVCAGVGAWLYFMG